MRLPSRTKLAAEYVLLAKKRRVEGLPVYGDFDPDTDTRNLSREAILEDVDVHNYLHFQKIKFPELHEMNLKAKRQAFELYVTLRHLEEMEKELTIKIGGAA